MALRVWLPLNGNLENKGTSNNIVITNNGATVNNSGKIGKCYTFNGNNIILNGIDMSNISALSVACWIKDTNTSSTQAIINCRTAVGNGLAVFLLGGKIRFDIGNTNCTFDWIYDLSSWTHICCTANGNIRRLYVNGNLQQEKTVAATYTTFGTIASIGMSSANTTSPSGNTLYASLNDFRFYDHALSKQEVKEIAQGLILHYKLSNNYINWLDDPKVNEIRTITRSSGNTFIDYTYNPDLLNSIDTLFTIEFDARGSAADMQLDVYFRNSGGSAYALTAKQSLTQNWKHYSLTINGSPANLNLFRFRCYSGTAGDIIYIKRVRLTSDHMPIRFQSASKGPTLQPYDPEYKIIDSSGYGHHGWIYDGVFITKPSARYESATGFPYNNGYIWSTLENFDINQWTVSYWYLEPENPTAYEGFFCLSKGDGSDANKKIAAMPNSGRVWYKGESGSLSISQLKINEWAFSTITCDGTIVRVYLNGEQIGTFSPSTTMTGCTDLVLGGRSVSSGVTSITCPYNGILSDFRLYCTALSAEDIATLYHTPAQIDNLGGVHGFEFMEKEINNLSDFTPSTNWVADGLTRTVEETNFGTALKLVTTTANKRTYRNVSNIWNANQEYNVSFLAKASADGIICNMSRSIADFSENFTLTTEWKKYVGTIKSTTTVSDGTLSFRIVSSSGTVYINNIKLELANPDLIKVNKNGIVNENNIDEINFNSINAQFKKISNDIIGNVIIEK